MKPFELKDCRVFDLFNNQWALATAGGMDRYNTCTIAWGSLGTIWGGAGRGRPIATIYINPDRYTWEKGMTDDGKEYYSKIIIKKES